LVRQSQWDLAAGEAGQIDGHVERSAHRLVFHGFLRRRHVNAV